MQPESVNTFEDLKTWMQENFEMVMGTPYPDMDFTEANTANG